MALTDRVFGAFENELVKQLSFSFTLIRRVDSTGAPKTVMQVWMRNDSSVPLKEVRGSISPGPAARFRFTSFHLLTLGPGKETEIAKLELTILEPTHNRFAYDRMATVNVSGTPDLTGFRFKDTSRGLTFVAPGSRLSAERPAVDPVGVERFENAAEKTRTIALDWSRVGRKRPA